jgi:hypothetical protein
LSRRDFAAALVQAHSKLRRREREIENLRRANEILREAAQPLIHHAAARDRFAFVHAHRVRFGVKRLCRALVTDSGNYFARIRAQSKRRTRERDERRLAPLITEVHTAQPAYGVQRITRELQRQGVPVGRRVVARLMRALGIAGVTRRKRRSLTKPDSGASEVPDLIRRDFTAPMPGLRLVGDISCFPTVEGWLYLATVLDLYSKELIGYALAPHMRACGRRSDHHGASHRVGGRKCDHAHGPRRSISCEVVSERAAAV